MTPRAKRSAPSGPLDEALQHLRGHRLAYVWDETDLKLWHAICPACRAMEWCLRLRESRRGGPITLRCSSGCTDGEIRAALEREPVEPRVEELEGRLAGALALADQAADIAARALTLAKVAA